MSHNEGSGTGSQDPARESAAAPAKGGSPLTIYKSEIISH